ncbi:MAG TPA: nucleotide sugar dehydrogenase [Planctomycetaceae bacterium]|jgi:UDP-N-acetyl-D-glucosamine dehydrogenase
MCAKAMLDNVKNRKLNRRTASPPTGQAATPAGSAAGRLSEALLQRTARVGVIGLGYVGLPLACIYHEEGFQVLGFDIDTDKVQTLKAGQSYIGHIPGQRVGELLSDGRFDATTDFSRIAEIDAVSICVPTPLTENREPDLSFIIATGRGIAPHLRKGQLVVLESTTYPGTTREVLLPILENGSGLKAGEDFFLAYSPEREDPGNANYSTSTIPKVVGGLDADSGAVATTLYGQVATRVVPVASLEVAEACKILENTYRAVNIALVNEMKVLFDRMGLSIWDVIDAAKTKPFGFQAFYPGPGLGGHCIPIDPYYLTWLARRYGLNTRFIELAGDVNSKMPNYVVDQVIRALNRSGKPVSGSRIAVLGIAYKKDVDDPRESPAFEIIDELLQLGAVLTYHDPHILHTPNMRKHTLCMESQPLTAEYLGAQDCVVIVTDHSAIDWDLVIQHAPLVVDPRNATKFAKGSRGHVTN